MNPKVILSLEFVESVPSELKDGTLYVSMTFGTVMHKCCCGCGYEVVTPLSPTEWKLFFNGEAIWLTPSIGNWSFPCESHYWIKNNRVQWVGKWSIEEIEAGRAREAAAKDKFFEDNESLTAAKPHVDKVQKTPLDTEQVPSIGEASEEAIRERPTQEGESKPHWWRQLMARLFTW